jgi:hypothetical protein
MVAVSILGRSENRREEEDPHQVARAIIRRLWMEDVAGLRARHDQQRREERREPIQNREIAADTNLPESTLSDWLRCKHYVVPDWERFSLVIGCLGATTKEWVPKWKEAKEAYDSIRGAGPRSIPHDRETRQEIVDAESDSPPTMSDGVRRPRLPRAALIVMSAVGAVVLGVGVFVLINSLSNESDSGFDLGTQPAAGTGVSRCVKVKDETNTVSVFKDPHGRDRWTEWTSGTKFRAEVDTSNPNRYRVLLQNGKYGYVSRDGRYVAPSDGCP